MKTLQQRDVRSNFRVKAAWRAYCAAVSRDRSGWASILRDDRLGLNRRHRLVASIAVAILRSRPKGDVTHVRSWADELPDSEPLVGDRYRTKLAPFVYKCNSRGL
jgi:hypothetical protein